MEQLKATLDQLIERLNEPELFRERLETLISVYPFNEYEFIISTLLGADILSLDEYYELRDAYLDRNLYLYLFEISAPRNFGEQWAQGHLKTLIPDLQRPSKKLDLHYSGQYDFWLETATGNIRIEVKASRAVDFDSDAIINIMKSDKKNIHEHIHFALLRNIGEPSINQSPDESLIHQALDFCKEQIVTLGA